MRRKEPFPGEQKNSTFLNPAEEQLRKLNLLMQAQASPEPQYEPPQTASCFPWNTIIEDYHRPSTPSQSTMQYSLFAPVFSPPRPIANRPLRELRKGEKRPNQPDDVPTPWFRVACHLEITTQLPKDYGSLVADSYLLTKSPAKGWELFYLDENKKLSSIPINQIQGLATILLAKKDPEFSNAELTTMEKAIGQYRTPIQNKPAVDTEQPIYVKFSNPGIALAEAVIAGYYRLIDPCSPKGWACYDAKGTIVAYASEGIPCFMPISTYPLTDKDLVLDFLENGEDIDYEMLNGINACYSNIDLMSYAESHVLRTITVGTNPSKNVELTARNLRNYRTCLRQGIMLANSYAWEENDLTINNHGLWDRFDYDLSLHGLTFYLKDPKHITDYYLRSPSETSFPIHYEDMKTLPILNHAHPGYFPGNDSSIVTTTGADILTRKPNYYPPEVNKTFGKLPQNKVFLDSKHKTFLKLILLERSMLEDINRLHLDKGFSYNNINLYQRLLAKGWERLIKIHVEAVKMDEFCLFMASKESDLAFKEIQAEFPIAEAEIGRSAEKIAINSENRVNFFNAFKKATLDAWKERALTSSGHSTRRP